MPHLKALAAFLESKATEGFLELLLTAMRLAFVFDWRFRRNIEGFTGRYLFQSQDGDLRVSAAFANGSMSVQEGTMEAPHLIVTFRDEKALLGFVLSPKPDILGAMLRQDVTLEGNLNYLYKFAYLARHLQLAAMGQL